jgi:hypothetical protein
MLAREKRLSLKANVHVERRTEEIMDAALTEWGERVSANLYRENATAQAGPADPQWPDPSPNAVFTSASHDMERSTLRVPYSQLTEVTIDRPGRLRKSGYRRPSEPQR